MAKFCGRCGARAEDTARACWQCGAPLDGASPRKPTGIKIAKILKRIVVVAVVVIAALIALNVVSKHTGYNGLVRKVMAAYEDYDTDELVSLASEVYYCADEEDCEDYFENSVGSDLDIFEDTVGHNYKLSYQVDESYALSDRKMGKLLDSLTESYPEFDESIIEKAVVAELTVSAKEGDQTSSQKVSITMTKEDGAWRLLYIN